MKKEEKMLFKKGDRVRAIGVAGVGTVKHDQETQYVRVFWDGEPHRDSAPYFGTLELVNPDVMAGAVKVLEEKRQSAIAERNALNETIEEMERAISLLKRV